MSSLATSSFDWQHYLELANELNGSASLTCDNQAVLRTCVSRAYYAAFHVARSFAIQCRPRFEFELKNNKKSVHDSVLGEFFNKGDSKHEIYVLLNRLRQERNAADYVPNVNIGKEVAENDILDAEAVVDRISNMP